MYKTPKLLTLIMIAAFSCTACTRISLSKKTPDGGSMAAPTATTSTDGGSTGGGFTFPDLGNLFSNRPPLNGEWKVTFLYKGEPHESTINFSQNGDKLSGGGTDDTGMSFILQNGTINGPKVHFVKKYTDADPNKQPVEYNGELTYSNDADFKGWSVGGHYKTNVNGEAVDDKWVAVSSAAEASTGGQQPAQPQPVAQQPDPQQPDPNQGVDTSTGGDQTGGEVPDHVGGMYTANYEFNFKRIETRLWLKQDGGKIGGDGTDLNTGEYFVISKGFFNPPRVMITCHYEKGKHAKSTRDLTVRAQLGPGPSLKGETQFGSPWTATIVR
jgi:hypothetical protein